MAESPTLLVAHSDELQRQGCNLRSLVTRSSHGELRLPQNRNPLGIIADQNARRLPDLVPVRMGRMIQSPFTYYRGTAGPMAYDLSGTTTTDLRVVSCGDAHISNFGFFASPERSLLFDLNDFDEAAVAPWEWDVKRLATSVYVGGRDNGFSESQCGDATRATVLAYQNAVAKLMKLSALERFSIQVSTEAMTSFARDESGARIARKTMKKARRRTSDHALKKITSQQENGRRIIVDEPPVTRHVSHISLDQLRDAIRSYSGTLREDVAVLLSQFQLTDFVLRVVGVGSVGTRCYVGLLEGLAGEALFLQVKEATTSVLVRYGGMPNVISRRLDVFTDHHLPLPPVHSAGHRVVAAQRVLQAQSDPFLGWYQAPSGSEYYFRQFRDMKGSVDVDELDPSQFARYGEACGALLARAHSQSPACHAIAGYLGSSRKFATSTTQWARSYADIVEADFASLEKAIRLGKIPCERGV